MQGVLGYLVASGVLEFTDMSLEELLASLQTEMNGLGGLQAQMASAKARLRVLIEQVLARLNEILGTL